ncbi:MAG TPA: hypothetical protein VF173_32155 [Thermoanaerobaculia bacterium]|nr:hypothetical protein [Thermoanaerobaculia bacterium]
MRAQSLLPPGEVIALDASSLWLGWEADPPRISQEERREEAESLYTALLALPVAERLRSSCSPEYRRLGLVEILLERSRSLQLAYPGLAKTLACVAGAVAAQIVDPTEDNSRVSVYLARAHYLMGNAWRLLGNPAEAEISYANIVYHFAYSSVSLDRAYYCRSLALLRWEQGRLDEAGALLARASQRFQESGPREESGTTLALLALLELEGQDAQAHAALTRALDEMDLERRPWLTVRVALALAWILASREQPDPALAVLQEVWRLAPRISDPDQRLCMRWWEGRVLFRLGDEHDAAGLLGCARRSYLEERRVPEAALASIDAMLGLAEAGKADEASPLADEMAIRLGSENGGDVALSVVRGFQRDLTTQRNLRDCAAAHSATLRRILRFRGFRIDPLPFA